MKITRVALAVPAVLLVAACGAGAGAAKPMSADEAGPASAAGSAPTAPDGARFSTTTNRNVAEDAEAQQTSVISKGQISLHAKEIDQARFALQKSLDQWGGSIANEESSADDHGRTAEARFELRIPVKHFDDAMNELPELGTLVDRSRNSEDVTTQVIDTNTRVRSQKLSLARIQALLAQAKDLNQVIAIEEQLSQRQADLDSLEQQQEYLADQTSLATINLYLSASDEAVGDEDDDTFLSGLHAGWKNLGSTVGAVLTGFGAVLPFAVLLALIGVPAWALWRRRGTKVPAGA